MIDWLKKRLTPFKKDIDRWVDLSESLQQFWEENFDDQLQELKDLSSVFSASNDNLELIMAELGDYFRDDLGTKNDWPIQILWRRLELQAKESDGIIQMVLRRKFLGLDIKWIPLYAHKTDEYGTNFKKKIEIESQGLDENDFFLTSRGKISLISPKWDQQGLTYTEFLSAIEDEIERTLPTHITYEGTDIIDDPLSLPLYFGGFVAEGISTTIQMAPFIYNPDLTQYLAGGVSTGTVVTISEDEA